MSEQEPAQKPVCYDQAWIRPRDPWEEWERDETSDENTSLPAHTGKKAETSTPISPEFVAFLSELEGRCVSEGSGELNKTLLTDVPAMISATFRRLEEKYPETFGGAVLHMVGSVGENTKLGVCEEFDFMVELQALREELIKKARSVEDEDRVNQIVLSEGFHLVLDDAANDEYVFEIPLKSSSREGVVLKEMFASLLPGWKVTSNMRRNFNQSSFVMQISLRYFPPGGADPIEVFLDISFCVLLEWTPEISRIYRRSAAKEDLKSDKQQYHLVIDWKSCPQTSVFMERDKVLNSPMAQNVKRVYRLAKILNQDFLPPMYDLKRDQFGGPVLSYWLKQIVMYMIDEFPEAESWADQLIGQRLLGLMSKLRRCVEDMTLSNYFWPDLNHLTESPKSKRVNKETAHDYVPAFSRLLDKAAKGDKSALRSLKTLSELTGKFRKSLTKEARIIRLNSMLYIHNKALQSKPREDIPFMADIHTSEYLMDNIREFAALHLRGDLEIRTENDQVKILYNDEELSVEAYVDKYVNDTAMHGRFFFGFFTAEWNSQYDSMVTKHDPDLASLLGKWC